MGVGDHPLNEPHGVMLAAESLAAQTAAAAKAHVEKLPKLDPAKLLALANHVTTRQRAVGYDCSLDEWIAKVTPPDRI